MAWPCATSICIASVKHAMRCMHNWTAAAYATPATCWTRNWTRQHFQCQGYLATDEWKGKAGAYAIQGRAESFVQHLSGSYSGVMGLPLHETAQLLKSFGVQ